MKTNTQITKKMSKRTGREYIPVFVTLGMLNDEEMKQFLQEIKQNEVKYWLESKKMKNGVVFYDFFGYGEFCDDLQDPFSSELYKDTREFQFCSSNMRFAQN